MKQDKSLPEEEWERIFRLKRNIEQMMEAHTFADVMAREKSPYLASEPNNGVNRAERRLQQARARKARP